MIRESDNVGGHQRGLDAIRQAFPWSNAWGFSDKRYACSYLSVEVDILGLSLDLMIIKISKILS